MQDIFEWTSPLVALATVGDPSGGLRWLLTAAVQADDVAEIGLAEADVSALPTAGLLPMRWSYAA